MFLPFKINITEIDKLKDINCKNKIKLEEKEQSVLNFLKTKFDFRTRSFDAEKIKEGWLPIKDQYNVFISYSHDDKEKALILVNWFESHGIKCFLDAYYWNNADKLLKAIDDLKCKNPDGKSYNYKKRNYSTSLIHAILSMAIMEAIDKCDIGIFIESQNSLTVNLDSIHSFSLSPWIYEELKFMINIEKRIPNWLNERQIRMFSEGTRMIVESKAPLAMRFSVPLDQFVELKASNLTSIDGTGSVWLNDFVKFCMSELKD